MENFKSGFVAVLGRPNVGKSTLINYLLGEKLVIVTSKPQTTRHKISAILTLENAQIILLDTPGLHQSRKELNKLMMEQALSAIDDNDLVIYITDTGKKSFDNDLKYIKLIENKKSLLIINKIDMIDKLNLLPLIERYSKLGIFQEIIPISLKKGFNSDKILPTILKYLPEGPKYYPEDIISNENERFLVAEMIREKIFILAHEEIPYSIGVIIDYFNEAEKIIKIGATIVVEKNSQKAIIIGIKGEMIKKIGIMARKELEIFLGKKVFLELFVKVIKNWTKDKNKVKNIFDTKIS